MSEGEVGELERRRTLGCMVELDTFDKSYEKTAVAAGPQLAGTDMATPASSPVARPLPVGPPASSVDGG
jgi:hypothetical protein